MSRKKNKIFLILSILIILILPFLFYLNYKNFLIYKEAIEKKEKISRKIEKNKIEIAKNSEEMKKINNKFYIENMIRDQYLYLKPGEKVIEIYK